MTKVPEDRLEPDEAEEGEAVETLLEEPISPKEKEEEESIKLQLLRLRADFANFRKRTEAERIRSFKFAFEPAAIDILDVADDMERALLSPEHGDDEWRKGVDMIYRKLLAVLDKNGVQPINSIGEPFDPHFHEAITAHPSPDVEKETVHDEVLKGYMLHDRVIRHSKVVVATPIEEENNDQQYEGDE